MRQKFLTLFVALLTVLTIKAHDFEVDGVYYKITSSTDLTVCVSYRGDSWSDYLDEYSNAVVIPESVTYNNKTYSVTSIDVSAFFKCNSLMSVEIPNTVTSIGEAAFMGCGNLLSIVIPNSVTSIGRYVFSGSGLISVVIPNSVLSISNLAFEKCVNLIYNEYDNALYLGNDENPYLCLIKAKNPSVTSCSLNNNTKVIADEAFMGHSGLTSISIPEGMTNIGDKAFCRCSGLTSVTIPSSVTQIGRVVFDGCSGLMSIVVDSNNKFYDSRNNCNAIIEKESNILIVGCQNTVIPKGVTSIGDDAFSRCGSLTNITIPEGVTSVGRNAFYECGNLRSIVMSQSVTSIGSSAFFGCSNLTSIAIPEGMTEIGSSAFFGCSNLTSIAIPEGVTEIGSGVFHGCSSLTSITIPDGVTEIGSSAFFGCSNLTSVAIPSSVTSIGYGAFMDCSGLTSVTINNPVPLSLGGFVFFDYSSYDVLPNLKIYVPKEAVEAYKEDESWSDYADIIFAIPTPTAVESIDVEKSQKVIKTIEDGKIVIIRDGVKWNLSGKKIDMK